MLRKKFLVQSGPRSCMGFPAYGVPCTYGFPVHEVPCTDRFPVHGVLCTDGFPVHGGSLHRWVPCSWGSLHRRVLCSWGSLHRRVGFSVHGVPCTDGFTVYGVSRSCGSLVLEYVMIVKVEHSKICSSIKSTIKIYAKHAAQSCPFHLHHVTRILPSRDRADPFCTSRTKTSLKDGDLQHSNALAQSPKGDIEPNHPSEINPKPDIQYLDRERMVAPGGMCNTGQTSLRLCQTETIIAKRTFSEPLWQHLCLL